MASKKPKEGKCGALIKDWKIKFGEKRYCSQTAGWGTDHPGTGKCKVHGGASTGRNGIKRAKREIKKRFEQEIEEFKNLPDSKKFDLDPELLSGKSLLSHLMNCEMRNYAELAPDFIRDITSLVDMNRKIIETQYKIKYADVSKFQVQVLFNLVDIIANEFKKVNKIVECKERDRAFKKVLTEAVDRAFEIGSDGDGPKAEDAEILSIGEGGEDRRYYDII